MFQKWNDGSEKVHSHTTVRVCDIELLLSAILLVDRL